MFTNTKSSVVELSLFSMSKWNTPEQVQERARLLSVDEIHKANAFRFNKDMSYYVIGRSLLRQCLAKKLNIEPSAVNFEYNKFGKPTVLNAQSSDLHFNVSHSDYFLAIATTEIGSLGVDLEFNRPMPDADTLVKQFFSTKERAEFSKLLEEEKTDAFWTVWTRKEAILKALGTGLNTPLDAFDVSLDFKEKRPLSRIAIGEESCISWHVSTYRPIPKITVSLAIKSAITPSINISKNTL